MSVEAGPAYDNPVWSSRRLWSLWDMLIFYAHKFVAVQRGLYALANTGVANATLDTEDRARFLKLLIGFELQCTEINLRVSAAFCTTLIDRIQDTNVDYNYDTPQIIRNINELQSRVQDELAGEYFLHLDDKESKLYEQKGPLFGVEVADKFKSAIYDMNEAGKCLALGRSTAAVFHLMHVVEIALRATHACLGLTAPDNPSWGIWLKDIREERIRRGDRQWPENDFFQDIYSRLDAIKDAQRDPTLHVQTIHTEEEAELIFRNTKAFMQKIASRMDENGEPKA